VAALSEPPSGDVTTIPVLATIARGCREAFRHGLVYTVYAVAWAVIAVLANLPAALPIDTWSVQSSALAVYYAASLLPAVVMLVGYAVIFVAVNRAIVLHEIPAWWRALRVGRRELRVFGFSLLFVAVGYLEMVVIGILVQSISHPSGIGAELLFDSGLLTSAEAAVIWSLLISATLTPFFGLAFSLAAIGATSRMFRRSLAWSRGHRWRLGAIGFLSALAIQIAAYAPFFIWADWNEAVGRGVVASASGVIYLWGAAIRAGAFGCAFRVIADGQHGSTYQVFD
jgi:hypothetical protein